MRAASHSPVRDSYGAAVRCATFCLLLCATLTAVASDWAYTLRPGDDLWSVARLQCGSSAFAQRLAAHNSIADPARVRAGQRIQIPVAWLVKQPASVVVLAVSGTASAGPGLALSVGQQLEMGDRVQTADGFVVVRFADGTELEIGADSDVLFNVLTAHGAAGKVDSQLRIYRGGGNVRVIKQGAASSFRIWTPAGIAAVRGTSFRIGVDAGLAASAPYDAADNAASRLETLTGLVAFERAAVTAEVPAGTGLVASAAGVVQEALLPAPSVSAGSEMTSEDQLEWQSAPGAVAQQIDIFDLRGSVPVLAASERLNAPGYALTGLTPGSYRAAIRGIAASGLEGLDATLPFTVLAARPEPESVAELQAAGALRWSAAPAVTAYEVQVARSPSFDDAVDYATSSLQLPLAETVAAVPGRYYWRVRGVGGAYSEPVAMAVAPAIPAAVELDLEPTAMGPAARLQWIGAPGTDYRIRLRDGTRTVVDETVEGTVEFVTSALPPGTYEVEIEPVANGVTGPSYRETLIVQRSLPWWRSALLAVPLLLLAL